LACERQALNLDWGVVFGLTGVGVGLISLVYARTQAINARRQADAAHLSGTLQAQQEMTDRIHRARMDLIQDPTVFEAYLDAIPDLKRLLPPGTSLQAVVNVRNSIDGLQDMYFLRKRSIAEDHHWLAWTAHFIPISRLSIARPIFLRPVFDGQPPADPKEP
jgi:hypothetical protein